MTDIMEQFWDERAAQHGELAGTQDVVAKRLEVAFIGQHVHRGMRVLDVGCGTGETVEQILSKDPAYVRGVDASSAMLEMAKARKLAAGQVEWVKASVPLQGDTDPFGAEQYDLVFTERLLVNVSPWPEQRQVIRDLWTRVKSGGQLVLVECSVDGLRVINEHRLLLGLAPVSAPPHTCYLLDAAMQSIWLPEQAGGTAVHYFTGPYYFLSRVIHAAEAKWRGVEPEYDHPINAAAEVLTPALLAMPGGNLWPFAQVRAWVTTKR